jgi:hypothetical protein
MRQCDGALPRSALDSTRLLSPLVDESVDGLLDGDVVPFHWREEPTI